MYLLIPKFRTEILTMFCITLSEKHWHNEHSVLLRFNVLIFRYSLCMKYSGLKYIYIYIYMSIYVCVCGLRTSSI